MDMDERDMLYEALYAAADLVLELRVVEPGAVPRVQDNRHERRRAAALARRGVKRGSPSMTHDVLVPSGSTGSGTTHPLTRCERAAGHEGD